MSLLSLVVAKVFKEQVYHRGRPDVEYSFVTETIGNEDNYFPKIAVKGNIRYLISNFNNLFIDSFSELLGLKYIQQHGCYSPSSDRDKFLTDVVIKSEVSFEEYHQNQTTIYFMITRYSSYQIGQVFFLNTSVVNFSDLEFMIDKTDTSYYLNLYDLRKTMQNNLLRETRYTKEGSYNVDENKVPYDYTCLTIPYCVASGLDLIDTHQLLSSESKLDLELAEHLNHYNYHYETSRFTTLAKLIGFELETELVDSENKPYEGSIEQFIQDGFVKIKLILRANEKFANDLVLLNELAKHYKDKYDEQIEYYERILEIEDIARSGNRVSIIQSRIDKLRAKYEHRFKMMASTRRILFKRK